MKKLTITERFMQWGAFCLLLAFCIFYVNHSWIKEEKQQAENILQVAKACEALLPKEEISKLNACPEDTNNSQYLDVKFHLREIVRVNKKIRFAYIWIERNEKIFFIADSEPETSENFSPPGQEYTEAKPEDKKPFIDGKEHITSSFTDQWGTWKSIYVPIKDKYTGKTTSVFGMDFNTESWTNNVLYSVIESFALIILILILFFIIIHIYIKNKSLKVIISERHKAETALVNSEQKFRNLVETSSDIIWETDVNEKYTYISPQIENILGYKPHELIGKMPFEIMPPNEAKVIQKISRDIVKSGKSFNSLVNTFIHKDGHKVIVETSGVPIFDVEGNLLGYRGVDRNITERKHTEDLITEHIRKIENANISLKANKLTMQKLMEDMEKEINERKHAEEIIKEKSNELERFNKLLVNREIKMIELKKEINELLKKSGGYEKYKNKMD